MGEEPHLIQIFRIIIIKYAYTRPAFFPVEANSSARFFADIDGLGFLGGDGVGERAGRGTWNGKMHGLATYLYVQAV